LSRIAWWVHGALAGVSIRLYALPASFGDRRETVEDNGIMASDFYLTSSEGYDYLARPPRRCRAIKRLRGDARDDYLLIRIDPPLNGQIFGLGEHDIDQVIVATRHRGASLFPITQWPVFVHVARLLVPYEGQDVVRSDELDPIAWAELYATEEAARTRAL
jgi:hypothetical protein